MNPLATIMGLGAIGVLGYYLWTTYQGVPESVSKPATGSAFGAVRNYTVRVGDTLGRIAAASGISYKDLLMLNPQFAPSGERSPDLIIPGESIRVR